MKCYQSFGVECSREFFLTSCYVRHLDAGGDSSPKAVGKNRVDL